MEIIRGVMAPFYIDEINDDPSEDNIYFHRILDAMIRTPTEISVFVHTNPKIIKHRIGTKQEVKT